MTSTAMPFRQSHAMNNNDLHNVRAAGTASIMTARGFDNQLPEEDSLMQELLEI